MKIAFITTYEILGLQNTAGGIGANNRLSLLKRIFGDENVYVCAITRHKENLQYANNRTEVFFSDRRKIHVLKYALSGRTDFSKAIEDAVLEHALKLDANAVFFDRSLIGFIPSRLPRDIKQIVLVNNIERDHIKPSRLSNLHNLILMPSVIANENSAINNADIAIVFNLRDAALLNKYYDRNPDFILPLTCEDNFIMSVQEKREKASPNSTLQLLFVGSLFASNEMGVTWFVNKIMPHVNAELTIVGKGFEKLADKLNRSNVRVEGTDDDVSAYYYSTDAVVLPIQFGYGMKLKTAEALMYGKPMFGTDEALEGYEIEDLENVHRCNTAQEFIAAINIYAENVPWLSFDEKIRSRFLEKYHTPIYDSVLRELLAKV